MRNNNSEATPEPWHMDKRVPVALIVAIAIQTAGAIWWASSINERVATNTTAIQVLDERTETIRRVAQTQAVQLGRIEEQISGLRADIGRLILLLERASE